MAQIALPHQLTNGTVADATQVMANFNAIVDVVNGNLGSDNLGSLSGADITVTDLNGGTSVLNNFTSRFQAGVVEFNNVPAEEFAYQNVYYPSAFPGAPLVFTTVNAGTPTQLFVSAHDATSTSFRITVRNDYPQTRSFSIPWLAVYTGAVS